jgi:hypothetical protein
MVRKVENGKNNRPKKRIFLKPQKSENRQIKGEKRRK